MRPLRTNPGANPSDTKGAGNHNPGRSKFHLLQPRPAGPETARTAGRSGRAGAFTTPALSPAFFHTGPAPHPRKRHIPRSRPNGRKLAHSAAPTLPTEPAFAGLRREPSCLPPPAPICLENPCWARLPYPARKAVTQRQTAGIYPVPSFSLYCVLVFGMLVLYGFTYRPI